MRLIGYSPLSKQDRSPFFLWLWGAFVLGLALRFTGLDWQSIWIDEAFSIQVGHFSLSNVLLVKDPTPPLYYLCLWGWMALTGSDAEVAVRALSALFGALAVPATYFTARRLLNEKVALLAALLVAISPINLFYSQMVRGYALLTLLSIGSIYFHLRVMEQRNWKTLLAQVVCDVLLVYTHVFGWFLIIARDLHFIVRGGARAFRPERWWILSRLVVIALFLPWFLRYMTTCDHHTWITGFDLMSLRDLVANLLAGVTSTPYASLFIVPAVGLLLFKRCGESLLYYWLIIPITVPVLISILVLPIFTPKYVCFVSIPLLILLADALFRFRWPRIATALAVSGSLALAFYQQVQVNTDPWREVVAHVERIRNDEPIAVVAFYEKLPFAYYFNRAALRNPDFDTALAAHGARGLAGLDELKAFAPYEFILITSRFAFEQEHREIRDYLEHAYDTMDIATFKVESYLNGNEISVLRLRRN